MYVPEPVDCKITSVKSRLERLIYSFPDQSMRIAQPIALPVQRAYILYPAQELGLQANPTAIKNHAPLTNHKWRTKDWQERCID
jgi:hypothetical protein